MGNTPDFFDIPDDNFDDDDASLHSVHDDLADLMGDFDAADDDIMSRVNPAEAVTTDADDEETDPDTVLKSPLARPRFSRDQIENMRSRPGTQPPGRGFRQGRPPAQKPSMLTQRIFARGDDDASPGDSDDEIETAPSAQEPHLYRLFDDEEQVSEQPVPEFDEDEIDTVVASADDVRDDDTEIIPDDAIENDEDESDTVIVPGGAIRDDNEDVDTEIIPPDALEDDEDEIDTVIVPRRLVEDDDDNAETVILPARIADDDDEIEDATDAFKPLDLDIELPTDRQDEADSIAESVDSEDAFAASLESPVSDYAPDMDDADDDFFAIKDEDDEDDSELNVSAIEDEDDESDKIFAMKDDDDDEADDVFAVSDDADETDTFAIQDNERDPFAIQDDEDEPESDAFSMQDNEREPFAIDEDEAEVADDGFALRDDERDPFAIDEDVPASDAFAIHDNERDPFAIDEDEPASDTFAIHDNERDPFAIDEDEAEVADDGFALRDDERDPFAIDEDEPASDAFAIQDDERDPFAMKNDEDEAEVTADSFALSGDERDPFGIDEADEADHVFAVSHDERDPFAIQDDEDEAEAEPDIFAIDDDDKDESDIFALEDEPEPVRFAAQDEAPAALAPAESDLFSIDAGEPGSESDIEITYHYRVAVVLNPHLETQINEARQSVNIPVAVTGIFELQSDFTTDALETVEDAVRTWAARHLPLSVSLERIEAEVIGAQRYIAGIGLEPAEALVSAQQQLVETLAPFIMPTADPLPFAPRLPVSDHTPAANFPRLVHRLEQEFDFGDWTILAVELLRTPEGDNRWEVVEKFTHTAA